MRFVCCLWRGRGFWRKTAKYNERHVEVLASMLKRHGGHELLCVHDGSFNVDGIRMPSEVSSLPDYLPKLWTWSPEFRAIIGGRFACIDLDVVILKDLMAVLDVDCPFRIWDYASRELYNSSLFVVDQGFGTEVWNQLSPEALSRAKRTTARWTGDQSWIAYVLGKGLPTFGQKDGVVNYRPLRHRSTKPKGILAAFMCGPYEPSEEAKFSSWVREAWV